MNNKQGVVFLPYILETTNDVIIEEGMIIWDYTTKINISDLGFELADGDLFGRLERKRVRNKRNKILEKLEL